MDSRTSVYSHVQVPTEGLAIISTVASAASDVNSPQSLSSEAELQHWQRVPNLLLPHSGNDAMCLSAGINAFVICNNRNISVISPTASPDEATSSTQTGQHSPYRYAPQWEAVHFSVPSQVTSSAAGGSQFAVSCSNGVQPACVSPDCRHR